MKNYFKIILITGLSLVSFSCTKDDDFTVFTDYIPVVVGENYENSETGSGSNEVAAATIGWLNVNFAGTNRVWNVKSFTTSGVTNNFAEFSSFYSNASDPDDEVWMITSKMNFAETPITERLSFDCQTRFANSAVLKVLISTNFNGLESGIHSATWQELTVALPTSNDVWVESGIVDLSEYQTDENVYIAFKYTGSKATGATTTFRLDNIRVFENK
ncbi:choice-of-anchor J domain-containing protein [Flavobacterium sp. J27]|uniref:choice-of-anchor J domain-containing protein n=1 Tax=Flavobacterium sp. J27 TaxID=2060419 RepID=UPI001031B42E|nr:choice-of-anchor J domain-containing protein [Flavobacterium sp. J27]